MNETGPPKSSDGEGARGAGVSADLPPDSDVVLVGGGHHALVAAAYLLAAGSSVCVIERMSQPGGWVRTAELGAAGFHHDVWSSFHPAFVGGPVWADLGPDLTRLGLRYVTAPIATASSLPDGRSAIAYVDQDAFAEELDRLGERSSWAALMADAGPYLPDLFTLLSNGLNSPAAAAMLDRLRRSGSETPLPFAALLEGTASDLVTRYFDTEELRSLALPWPLHLGLGPQDGASALWAVFALASLAGGNPTPIGGSGRLTQALTTLVTERGGIIVTGSDVDTILTRGGRAAGVRTTDGSVVRARHVIASVTPDQLYGRLLRKEPGVPQPVRSQASQFTFRRGCFQLGLALSARPRFLDERLDAGGAMNLGSGIGELLRASAQRADGLLPAHPTVAWHEPTAVDPSRAPTGKAIARLQVLDVPHTPRGDAAGTRHGGDGWDTAATEAFADRVVAEAERHLPGLSSLILERHVTTPADLAAASPNAGPGDHGAGDNALAQGFAQRPIAAHHGGYTTAVPGVWLTGAATWPGPGVSGGSGRAVAHAVIDAVRGS